MKRITLFLCAALGIGACSTGEDGTEYLPAEVSFALSDPAGLLADGSRVALIARCRRDGKSEAAMSEAPVARYTVVRSGDGCALLPVADRDRVYVHYDDHEIVYLVYSPYSEDDALGPLVPEVQQYGEKPAAIVCGSVRGSRPEALAVIPVCEKPRAAVLSLEIPADLVAAQTVTLKRMTVMGVRMEFLQGLPLSENRIVDVAVHPFTVPQGGIPLTFVTSGGESLVSVALPGAEDSGHAVRIGETYAVYVPSADDFRPVRFPVVFPLGRNPQSRMGYYCNHDEQPEWYSQGIWRCHAQKQAYAKWVSVSRPHPAYQFKREIVGTKDIGSIGLKGIWTGDYFEFVFPVDFLAAGTEVSFKAPFYGRNQPIFWTVEWLEGDTWTSEPAPRTSFDGSVTLDASFATRLFGTVVEYGFTLGKAIERDTLRVRIKCTDGRYQACYTEAGHPGDPACEGKVIARAAPYISELYDQYYSPFYFYCENSDVNAFTWHIGPK